MGIMHAMGDREWFLRNLKEVAARHPCLTATQWQSGDTKLVWDPDRADEVAAVKDLFDTLKKKGYRPFGVRIGGEKGDILDAFDPSLGKIIMALPMRGG